MTYPPITVELVMFQTYTTDMNNSKYRHNEVVIRSLHDNMQRIRIWQLVVHVVNLIGLTFIIAEWKDRGSLCADAPFVDWRLSLSLFVCLNWLVWNKKKPFLFLQSSRKWQMQVIYLHFTYILRQLSGSFLGLIYACCVYHVTTACSQVGGMSVWQCCSSKIIHIQGEMLQKQCLCLLLNLFQMSVDHSGENCNEPTTPLSASIQGDKPTQRLQTKIYVSLHC